MATIGARRSVSRTTASVYGIVAIASGVSASP
jgi:hypothetical protein